MSVHTSLKQLVGLELWYEYYYLIIACFDMIDHCITVRLYLHFYFYFLIKETENIFSGPTYFIETLIKVYENYKKDGNTRSAHRPVLSCSSCFFEFLQTSIRVRVFL